MGYNRSNLITADYPDGFQDFDPSRTGNPAAYARNIRDWAGFGDSRMFDHNSTSFNSEPFTGVYGKTCKSPISWAMAYYKQSFRVVENWGIGGKRTDEYLTNGNFEKALAGQTGLFLFMPPCYNDIKQALATYTDYDGTRITLTNVVDRVLARMLKYITLAIASGRQVLAFAEWGGTDLNAAQVACVHEFNRKYREALRNIYGVTFYNPNRLIWDCTSSTTLIAFKTNFSDGVVHLQQQGGRVIGKDLATNILPTLFAKFESGVSNTSDLVANGTGQLFTNPLFTTTSGGTNSGGNITINSGTVPAGLTISATAACTVDIAATTNADGLGNDIKFSFATNVATLITIQTAGFFGAAIAIGDEFEMGFNYDIDAGNTANIYAGLDLNANVSNATAFDMLGTSQSPPMGNPSGIAETGLEIRTIRRGFFPGNTTASSVVGKIYIYFPNAGAQTSAPTFRTLFVERFRNS